MLAALTALGAGAQHPPETQLQVVQPSGPVKKPALKMPEFTIGQDVMQTSKIPRESLVDPESTVLQKLKKMTEAEQHKFLLQRGESVGGNAGVTDPPQNDNARDNNGNGERPERRAIKQEEAERDRITRAQERLDELEKRPGGYTPKELGAARRELIDAQRAYQADPDPTPTPKPSK